MASSLVYETVFGITALACLLSLPRAWRIEDRETRYGMSTLLAGSGGWALVNVLFLVLPTIGLKNAVYIAGLSVGLGTVGAWLYFCSAYTGRTLHRSPFYRRLAVAVYTVITVVKVTNPIHEQYFSIRLVSDPFLHATINHEAVHYVVTGLAYVLAGIGFFMIYETFSESEYDTRLLGGVVALAGVPVGLDLVADAGIGLINLNYEPIGVAVFALSVLYVFEGRFLAVPFTGDVSDATVFLDADDRVRDYNEAATTVFPGIERNEPAARSARLEDALDGEESIVEVAQGEETRYYLVGDASFSFGDSEFGRMVTLTDVTETERRRRELRRHNEQLEDFAAGIRHELHNALQVVGGRIEVSAMALSDDDAETARDSLEIAAETTDRMRSVVDDLSTVARYGRTPEEFSTVPFRETVEGAWTSSEVGEATLSVSGEGDLKADGARLHELFVSVFEFADLTDTDAVTVSLRGDGFAATYHGGPSVDNDEAVFDYGEAIPNAEAGVALPKVRTLARVHGWRCSIESSDDLRVVVSGVVAESTPVPPPSDAVDA